MSQTKSCLFVISLAVVTLAIPVRASNCKNIQALIVDSSAPQGCTSPFGFCAAGTVQGNHQMNGTTYFVLDGVSSPPATAPGWGVTSGLLVYTTKDGTLTVRETGVGKLTGHPSNGYLTSIEEVISGTGRFAGATGFLYNNATDVNSVFYSNISGQLCFAGDDGGDNQ
jgi:hypothetical protein